MSVRLGCSGFRLAFIEEDVILWHMGGVHRCHDEHMRKQHFAASYLGDIIHKAAPCSINEPK